jgi:hypothetical protein
MTEPSHSVMPRLDLGISWLKATIPAPEPWRKVSLIVKMTPGDAKIKS